MEDSKYDVFLSHNSQDKLAVEELAHRLDKEGIKVWLDKWNLIPGDPWQEAIEEALQQCRTCAVFVGPGGVSPWENEEMRAAINRRISSGRGSFRVIPVLLPGSVREERSRLPAFLVAATWVEFRKSLDDEDAFHRFICGIKGIPPGKGHKILAYEGQCPYRGLQFFDVEHAPFFFGREAVTEWLINNLRNSSTQGKGNRFLAIIGPSGSGKSSLVRAGLIASLKKGKIEGSENWPIVICRPGAEPLESLAVAFEQTGLLKTTSLTVFDLIDKLRINERTLHIIARLALDSYPDQHLVLLVDQFEELFTLCKDKEICHNFINNLVYASSIAQGKTIVLLTLRADFYSECAPYTSLAATLSEHQMLIGSMTKEEIRSVIEKPAQLVGCEFEGGLVETLLHEVEDQPGALPLLQHALLELWERRQGNHFTKVAYQEIGGIEGSLEKRAEAVYAGFNDSEKQICRKLFLRLIQIDDERKETKRQMSLKEIVTKKEERETIEAVVLKLARPESRLVITESAEQKQRDRIIEVAHEALIQGWTRLQNWLDEDREFLLWRQRLQISLMEWRRTSQDEGILLRGASLAEAERWLKERPHDLSVDEKCFLTSSISLKEQEQKAKEEAYKREVEHQRRERRRLFTSVASTLVLLVLLAVGGFAAWNYYRTTIEYYADYAEKWGVPYGIGKLTQEEVEHREHSWQIIKSRHKVRRLLCVNSSGHPRVSDDAKDSERPVDRRYFFRETGKLAYVDDYSKTGQFLLRRRYSEDMSYLRFHYHEGMAPKHLTSTTGIISVSDSEPFEVSTRSSIVGYHLTYSKDGRIEQVRYLNSSDWPTGDAEGIFGKEFTFLTTGQVQMIRYLDAEGNPCPLRYGVAGRRYTYDEDSMLTKTEWIDHQGNPTRNPDFVAWVTYERDEWGNLVNMSYFDSNGKPCLHKDGYHKWMGHYDEHGNAMEGSYFGLDSKPCLHKDGYHRITQTFDEHGNIMEQSYFGTDGELCLGKDGYHRITQTFDEHGNITEQSYFGTDGEPCLGKDDYHKLMAYYDDRGNVTELFFFGIDGGPCLGRGGYHKGTTHYDDRGNVIEESFFGTDGKPCLHKDGFHQIARLFDERGNIIEESYFGTDGKPCLHKDGFHQITRLFDERGNVTEQFYFGTDGKPCLSKTWLVASFTRKYDERGNITEESYFGSDGKPCLHKDGYHRITQVFDEHGNITAESYFDTDEKPCLSKTWLAASLTRKYDEHGNMTEQSYFGTDGNPCLGDDAYHKGTSQYDEQGNITKLSYFGTDEKPCLSKTWLAASLTRKYDEHGNMTEQSYFDTDGKPCQGKNGYHSFVQTFDERGNITKQSYFGKSGEPCLNYRNIAVVEKQYDERGLVIRTRYLGIDGKPCLLGSSVNTSNPDDYGYAESRKKYDSLGRMVQALFLGIDGNPVATSGLGPKLEIDYDKHGNQVEARFFGIDGELRRPGAAIQRFSYDSLSRETRKEYFDADAQPFAPWYGIARIDTEYDERGYPIEASFYGTDGKLTASTLCGHAIVRYEYDSRGNEVARFFFGADGKPVLYTPPADSETGTGIAGVRFAYDERGFCIEKRTYGIDGQLACSNQGYAIISFQRDLLGKEVERRTFDEYGDLCENVDGIAVKTTTYDNRGNYVRILEQGVSGNTVRVTKYEYDVYDNIIKVIAIGPEGKRIKRRHTVILGQITAESPAGQVGIEENDILVCWGDWDFFQHTSDALAIQSLPLALGRFRDVKKDVCIARAGERGEYTIKEFHLPPGMIGARVMDSWMMPESEYKAVFKTYEQWKSKKKSVSDD